MSTLSRFTRLGTAAVLLGALLLGAGCRNTQKPDPSMTAVRGIGTSTRGADWVSPEDMAAAGALGLQGRDASLVAGNRLENLFSPVFFDFDQSFIRPGDRPTLQQVASYLAANPTHRLLVIGHCDWRGTTEYNMALGDRRAKSVTAYLEQLGVSPTRMETLSKGDLEAVTEGTEEQMQFDRRADLVIITP